MNEIISPDEDYIWVNIDHKGYYDYVYYDEAEVADITGYMLNTVTGEKVGELGEKEFDEGYIYSSIELTETLNEADKYVVVIDDGQTIRMCDDFKVTSKSDIYGAYFNTNGENHYYSREMTAGVTEIYCSLDYCNIDNPADISVEILDDEENVIATGAYEKNHSFKLTASKPVEVGEYLFKATYGDEIYTKYVTFVPEEEDSEDVSIYVQDAIVYGEKTYILLRHYGGDFDWTKLTYKVSNEAGEELLADFHRKLNNRYCVVTIDEALDAEQWDVIYVDIYNGSTLLASDYVWIETTDSPFVYNMTAETDTTVDMFCEGYTDDGAKYEVYVLIGETETGVTVPAFYDSAKQAISINKSELDAIEIESTAIYKDYVYLDLYVEKDGVYVAYYDYYSENMNVVLDDVYAFSKPYTNCKYAVLNLPVNTYTQYKTADTAEGLETASYKAMEPGTLYEMPGEDGFVEVYAMFKSSDGTESEVRKAAIIYDTTAPEADVQLEDESEIAVDENGFFDIYLSVNSNEIGRMFYSLLDKYGNIIGYEEDTYIDSGTSSEILSFNCGDYAYEHAKKLVCSIADNAGNKTEEFEFDISIVEKYIEYTAGPTTMYVDKDTGVISVVDDADNKVTIPEEIEGVTVTGIGEYAFEYVYGLQTIIIPSTVTSIADNAFEYNDALTHVYFMGTEEEWNAITVGAGNEHLENAQVTYNVELGVSEAVVSRESDTVVVTLTQVIPENSKIIIAGYADGALTGTVTEVVNDMALLPSNTELVKVFVWDITNGLEPLYDVKSVTVE